MREYGAALIKCPGTVTRPAQRLACVLPEFGGATIDSTGVLNVFITDLAIIPRAQRIVQLELERDRRSQMHVRFIKGDFSYQQLDSIMRQLVPYMHPGIASWGIDEWNNRVRVAFVTDDARVRLENAIRTLGLPRKAIVLEKGEYSQVLSGRDR